MDEAEQSAHFLWLGCREAERSQTVKGLKNYAPHEVPRSGSRMAA